MRAPPLGRRSPPAAWEGFFLIGIFPEGSSLRWCKVQLFSGGRDPRRRCLSALEGIDGPGGALVLLGRPGEVETHERPLDAAALARAEEGWDIRAPGLVWQGGFPRLELALSAPSLRATSESRDLVWWARLPRVLSYWSAFGPLRLEGAHGVAEGLGLVEHAHGADTRLDVLRLSPRWHWDVLRLEGDAFCAGLALSLPGGLVGRTAARASRGDRARASRASGSACSRGATSRRRAPTSWRSPSAGS